MLILNLPEVSIVKKEHYYSLVDIRHGFSIFVSDPNYSKDFTHVNGKVEFMQAKH